VSGKEFIMSVQRVTSAKRQSAPKAGNADRPGKNTAKAFAESRPGESPVLVGKTTTAKLALRNPDIGRALARLAAEGKVAGVRSGKISARVDPRIFSAAAARLGLAESEVSDVVNASLAIAAAPDRFKAWLKDGGDALPDDFVLAI
jgi:hypothetical protein